MSVEVKVSRRKFKDEHDNQKWYVLVGEVEGCPAVTKTHTISMAELAADPSKLQAYIEKMKSDVAEYHANYLALQQLPDEL